MDKDKLTNAIARAQKLMLDENFNAKVEGMARSMSGGGSAAVDISAMEKQAFGAAYSSPQSTEKPITLLSETIEQKQTEANLSKLPAAIRESFTKTPPMTGDNSVSDPIGSIASKLVVRENVEKPVNTKPNENVSVNGTIDYSLIKTIVDESIRRNIDSIKEEVLKGSAGLAGLKMLKGNRIQLVDTNGNLYEGVLSLKRKAKK